jgi:plasmid stabilization system protein ParE
MAKKQPVIPQIKTVNLTIKPLFWETLQSVLRYSLSEWGAVVMYEFLQEVNRQVLLLYSMPDVNPVNRFLQSTKSKVYRNIIMKKYPYIIIYSVTNDYDVKILNIIHNKRDPQSYRRRIK